MMKSLIRNTEQVRSILDGSCTCFTTDKGLRDINEHWNIMHCGKIIGDWPLSGFKGIKDGTAEWYTQSEVDDAILWRAKCPFPVGHKIYVRESFLDGYKMDDGLWVYDEHGDNISVTYYAATDYGISWWSGSSDFPCDNVPWKSAAVMPKSLARIWLEVTDIQVVQEDGKWLWQITFTLSPVGN